MTRDLFEKPGAPPPGYRATPEQIFRYAAEVARRILGTKEKAP